MDEGSSLSDSVRQWREDLTMADEERAHHQMTINTFRSYFTQCSRVLNEKRKWYYAIGNRQRSMIPNYERHLDRVQMCIAKNQEVLNAIAQAAAGMFINVDDQRYDFEADDCAAPPPHVSPASQVNSLCSVIRHFVRDWSTYGSDERERCYSPVLEAANNLFAFCGRGDVRVLVPGAGLGRLAWEFANAGYWCEGNEQSLLMLFCSNFVINHCDREECFVLYPFVNQWNNNVTYDDQLAPVHVPDVNPRCDDIGGRFSMAGGCFLTSYGSQRNYYDLIATVFFLDTAPNVIAYIETIHRLLKPDGYWINMGPLLYHFCEVQGEMSLELPMEEVRRVIEQYGFRFVEERVSVPTQYTANPFSMLCYTYKCWFFVCRKTLMDETS